MNPRKRRLLVGGIMIGLAVFLGSGWNYPLAWAAEGDGFPPSFFRAEPATAQTPATTCPTYGRMLLRHA